MSAPDMIKAEEPVSPTTDEAAPPVVLSSEAASTGLLVGIVGIIFTAFGVYWNLKMFQFLKKEHCDKVSEICPGTALRLPMRIIAGLSTAVTGIMLVIMIGVVLLSAFN